MATSLRFRLNSAVQSTPRSPIALARAWGEAYAPTPSRPLIQLSQGVPGVPPPKFLLNAIGEAARDPASCGYGPMCGDLAMRKALAAEMKTVYGASSDVSYEDVSITAGCNMSFVTVAMTLAKQGDEIILPIPWMTLQMLGIEAVPLACHASQKFIPSVEDCENLITSKTKAIALVTPNNPTGAIYPPRLLFSFMTLAQKHNIALIIDETYRDLITSGLPHELFGSHLNWRSTFIHLFSFSKSYCVPGHRLGAIIASSDLLDHINTVLDCIQICPPRPIQAALHPVLPLMRPFIRQIAQTIEKQHKLFESVLPEGWIIGSQGAYYAFVRHPIKGVSALDVSMRLAKDFGVTTLPASFFGLAGASEHPGGTITHLLEGDDDRWIRFSIANVDAEDLKKVRERLMECEKSFREAR